MYGGLGVSAPSLHRESTDSLIRHSPHIVRIPCSYIMGLPTSSFPVCVVYGDYSSSQQCLYICHRKRKGSQVSPHLEEADLSLQERALLHERRGISVISVQHYICTFSIM